MFLATLPQTQQLSRPGPGQEWVRHWDGGQCCVALGQQSHLQQLDCQISCFIGIFDYIFGPKAISY